MLLQIFEECKLTHIFKNLLTISKETHILFYKDVGSMLFGGGGGGGGVKVLFRPRINAADK